MCANEIQYLVNCAPSRYSSCAQTTHSQSKRIKGEKKQTQRKEPGLLEHIFLVALGPCFVHFWSFVLYTRPLVCLLNCAFSCQTDRRPNITCHPLCVRHSPRISTRSSKWFYSVSVVVATCNTYIFRTENDCHLTTIYIRLFVVRLFAVLMSLSHTKWNGVPMCILCTCAVLVQAD